MAHSYQPMFKECLNSSVHLYPELLRVASDQSIKIGYELHIDPNVSIKRDWIINWYIWKEGDERPEPIKGGGAIINFQKKEPGRYEVHLELVQPGEGCSFINDSVTIEVLSSEPPKPPPDTPVCEAGHHKDENGNCVIDTPTGPTGPTGPPAPIICSTGYRLDTDNKTCVKDTCMTGFHMGADGKTCERTDDSKSCPAGYYNSSGTCLVINPSSQTGTIPTYPDLSSNYQDATTYTDVFKTPETDTPVTESMVSTQTLLLATGAVVGIGGLYYMYSVNGRRRY
jgi:hypothetical protein